MLKDKHLYFISSLLLAYILSCFCACQPKTVKYIQFEKPSNIPQLFAPGFISKDSVSEYGSVFNEAVTEFFFAIDKDRKSEILWTKLKNDQWTKPEVIIYDPKYSFNDPFLSVDESKLYYISDLPRNEKDTINDFDIWYSNRVEEGWSEPVNAGMAINSDANEFYISFTESGDMYFASNKENWNDRKHDFHIYKSEFKSGEFLTPIKLDSAINTRAYEADVFVAPDESYIIFCSARRSGLGRGDLYISFKDEKNQWKTAVNMGEPINSEGHEICPFVTKDGKYFFYASDGDIYWVSAEVLNGFNR